ncbi:tetratricopeptide repeat-containing sulfotransferase family protein [Dyella sp.]|uniref:tetratricopeptide repeat-containing sulfotransferase family protein n=1 Tax=Dyella sp. TaxID=1869338 RepID=UPI003F81A7D9
MERQTSFNVSPTQLWKQVHHHIESGNLDHAQVALESLVRLAPADTAASIDLADVMYRRGQFQASSRPLLQAATRLPRDVPLILALTQRLIARGEIATSRACLDLVAQAPNSPGEALFLQANLRFMIGETCAALELADRAVRSGADTPDAWRLYAMLLQFNGRDTEACEVLEKCLMRWPDFADIAPILVDLGRQTAERNYLPLFRKQLCALPEQPVTPGQAFARAEFEYAAFKTLDDIGRHKEAWEALSRCNSLMQDLNPYDSALEEAVTEALLELPSPLEPRTALSEPFEGPVPIFIVGMPRSGTTLLDRILSSHSQVTSAGEIVDFWRQFHWMTDVLPGREEGFLRAIERSWDINFRLLGYRYLKQTQWRAHGRSYYVDKLPGNVRMVPFIRRALPHAPILHIVRDPLDTCFSNFKAMYGNISPYSYELGALAHYYKQYSRQVSHWQKALRGAMLDVDYSSLVQNPATVIPDVLAHCGLNMETACLRPERNTAPVATRSTAQVREPINTKGLGQWRPYAEQLEPLRAALASK